MFTSNARREFEPCDEVFPLIVVYRALLLLHKNTVVSRQFYP